MAGFSKFISICHCSI